MKYCMDFQLFMSLLCIHTFLFIWSSSLASCSSSSSVAAGNETDQLALLAFKANIHADPFGALSNWNERVHFCKWYGVTCGRRHERVTRLVLSHQKLRGTISPYIGNLSFLRILNIENNSFYHHIPPEIGHLRRLRALGLNNNSISGEIPSNISACSRLVYFYASQNRLVGRIPAEVGLLQKLRFLYIHKCNLTGGIPSSLGNLSSLEKFSIRSNSITRRIPESFGKLKNLQFLSLEMNTLTGLIPPSLFNLSYLTDFGVLGNQLQGILPSNLFITLPNLKSFSVSENQFKGPIPSSLSNATNLELFQASENHFSGMIPPLWKLENLQWLNIFSNNLGSGGVGDLDFLCSSTNLTDVSINRNNFGGVLPECLSTLTKLKTLFLSINKISGQIPPLIGNLVELEYLSMQRNSLTGEIPYTIGNLKKLKILALSENNFSGNIPTSLGYLTMLIKVYLYNNNLQGNIPSTLGRCKNLNVLALDNNNLTGTIPKNILTLPSLSVSLDFSNNRLTGPLPVEVGKLIMLAKLDVANNMLSGEIPASLGECESLEYLYMGGNQFNGTIPSTLSNLRAISEIDLSRNNFSGNIPSFLKDFRMLEYLNLSYNNFEGPVPTEGVAFVNKTVISLKGNKMLCGGIPELQLPICKYGKGGLATKTKWIVAIVSAIGGIACLVIIFFLVARSQNKNIVPASGGFENSNFRLSYQDLHNATNGFSSAHLIGVGSFGSVYKGLFDRGLKVVAIKVFNLHHHGAYKSFVAECTATRNIRHRNLVKVLTACSGIDYQGNDFRALVYDFMVNGSLNDWLHPSSQTELEDTEPISFNLLRRLNVAEDIASALDYLHNHCVPPIAHCDLKPSNVLLDSEMTAHVSDFGLAKFLSDNFASQSSSIGVRGSTGYAAPEYGLGENVSTRGDVYSYGILLLEMFTGKRPSDDTFIDGLNLHNFAELALRGNVLDVVDPLLLREITMRYARNKIVECLTFILEVGVRCSMERPAERMNICDAIAVLKSARRKIFG